MTHELILTKQQARRFILAHHGLWPPYELGGKKRVLGYIRHVGCIQFDPLNIAGRSPDLVLQARVAGYRPQMLQDLLYTERRLLDGWDKNMSIWGVEDWPHFQRRRERARTHYGDSERPAMAIVSQVRQAIQERGPLSSIDLDFGETVDWSWAPTRLARAALESMYFWGELIVHHKVNTRKVYDFAHRHISEALLSAPEPNPTEEGHQDWYVHRRIGGLGLIWNRAGDAWLGMRPIMSRERAAALKRLLAQGKVVQVKVEGVDWPLYMRSKDRGCLDSTRNSAAPTPQAVILAPLDNLLWDRRLISELFGFSYIWEVYKPVAERQYGYYVLPILYGDRFVARFEPVRDKKTGALVIKGWWWEPGIQQTEEMRAALCDCLRRFLLFHGANYLKISSDAEKATSLDWMAGCVNG